MRLHRHPIVLFFVQLKATLNESLSFSLSLSTLFTDLFGILQVFLGSLQFVTGLLKGLTNLNDPPPPLEIRSSSSRRCVLRISILRRVEECDLRSGEREVSLLELLR